jgi:hypothetical protein
LGVCHTHDESALPVHTLEPGGSIHGNTYRHHFFLLRDAPPYDVLAVSPAFCFPSAADGGRCDVIQFVMSLDATRDGFRVSYGVNDCEAAAVELALDDILAFTESGLGPDVVVQLHEIGAGS